MNPIHFNPISLINSAVSTDCCLSFEPAVARLYSSFNPSGEFIVIVAAVYEHQMKHNLLSAFSVTSTYR